MNLRVAHLIIAAVGEIAAARKHISSQELTARLDLAPRRLEPYLQALVRAGIIGAERGPRGGYFLRRPLSELTVAAVLLAADPGYSIPTTPPLAKHLAVIVRDALNEVLLSDLLTQAEENSVRSVCHTTSDREDILVQSKEVGRDTSTEPGTEAATYVDQLSCRPLA
jgi:DNA-binding IscR family transcriptional regulator